MTYVSSSMALCLLGIVVRSSFSSPAPRPVTAHCQCSDSSLDSMLVDRPQSHDDPMWSVLLVVTVALFCDGCAGASAQFLPCGFAAWYMRHIQFGQDLTRTPLYEAGNDRSNYWRVTRRAEVQRDEYIGIAREWANAVRTGPAVASIRGRKIRRSRRFQVLQSGPGRSAYCNIGGTSMLFHHGKCTSKDVTHSWSSVVGALQVNVLHMPFGKSLGE